MGNPDNSYRLSSHKWLQLQLSTSSIYMMRIQHMQSYEVLYIINIIII